MGGTTGKNTLVPFIGMGVFFYFGYVSLMLFSALLLNGVEYMELLRDKRAIGDQTGAELTKENAGPRERRTAFFLGKAHACKGNQ